jgi:N-acylneuraminate cytidylyltransferase
MTPCIIPARGGSKGIRRKNVVPVFGKPLIAWSILHALGSRRVDDVCVATDDEEIAGVAADYGVRVFWRSAESASDHAQTEVVLQEAIESWYVGAEYVVLLQATSPMRQQYDIDHAIDQVIRDDADSLFSACRIHGYTWERRGTEIVSGYGDRKPRQSENVERLEENGSIYVFKPWVVRKTGMRIGGRISVYVMDRLDSFQIDEAEDIELIESLMAMESRGHADTHAVRAI